MIIETILTMALAMFLAFTTAIGLLLVLQWLSLWVRGCR